MRPPVLRRTAVVVAVVAGVLLLLWGAAYAAAGSGVPKGTTVRGIAIGGLSPAEAERKLERDLADDLSADIPAVVGNDAFPVDPAAAGLGVDLRATVEAAGGRTWRPAGLVKSLRGGGEIEPVVTVDDKALEAAVAALAARADTKPVDGGVRFRRGEVEIKRAVPGRVLERDRAAAALRGAFLAGRDTVALPAAEVKPKIPQTEVDRAVREFAEPAMSAPVTLVVNGERLNLPPERIGPALTMKADASGRLQPELDAPKLKKVAAKVLDRVEVEGASATFRIVNGRPRVVPSRQGRVVDPLELAGAVMPALTKTGEDRTASVSLRLSDPEVTTAEAEALGVRELVSEYTTYYPSNFQPRLTNIHRAADYMDNTLLLPGETFSLNAEVGERTAARGFAAGYIIRRGKLAVDLGGGVSQLATTTFNAAFFAGLEDVEHHPHSFYISRYPEGREATVAWGAKDLRFRNNSGHGIFITTSYTNSSITVRIYGTKIYRIETTKSARSDIKPFKTVHDPRPRGTRPGDCVLQEGVLGFKVSVTRKFFLIGSGGPPLRTERFHTTYQPEDRVICDSTGPRTPG